MYKGQQIFKAIGKHLLHTYMDNLKVFARNEKKKTDSDTSNKNLQSGYWDEIRRGKMCPNDNEKLEKKNRGRNSST